MGDNYHVKYEALFISLMMRCRTQAQQKIYFAVWTILLTQFLIISYLRCARMKLLGDKGYKLCRTAALGSKEVQAVSLGQPTSLNCPNALSTPLRCFRFDHVVPLANSPKALLSGEAGLGQILSGQLRRTFPFFLALCFLDLEVTLNGIGNWEFL